MTYRGRQPVGVTETVTTQDNALEWLYCDKLLQLEIALQLKDGTAPVAAAVAAAAAKAACCSCWGMTFPDIMELVE